MEGSQCPIQHVRNEASTTNQSVHLQEHQNQYRKGEETFTLITLQCFLENNPTIITTLAIQFRSKDRCPSLEYLCPASLLPYPMPAGQRLLYPLPGDITVRLDPVHPRAWRRFWKRQLWLLFQRKYLFLTYQVPKDNNKLRANVVYFLCLMMDFWIIYKKILKKGG